MNYTRRFSLVGISLVALFGALVGPLSGTVSAQETDGFDSGFDSGFGGSEADTDSGFGASFFGTAVSAIDWHGRVRFDSRAYADYDTLPDSEIASFADLMVELSYTGANSELVLRAETDHELRSPAIDEAYFRLFYDRFGVQAGYAKTVWGSGDGSHVVDLLNSSDLDDFINPDYLERRLSVPMVKGSVAFAEQRAGGAGLLEFAVIPTLEPDLFPQEGRWAPADVAGMIDLVEGFGQALVPVYAAYLSAGNILPATDTVIRTLAESLAQDAASGALRYENTDTLDHAQVGARASVPLGPVDLAGTVYWGYKKTPSPEVHLASAISPGQPSPGGYIDLTYDRLWAFGVDAATVLGPFNTRAEGAYYLTGDINGDDPTVPNNTIEYLVGFDVDIPVSNLNVNAQVIGSYILKSETIDDAGLVVGGTTAASLLVLPAAQLNYEYDVDGIYTNSIASVALTDSFANERILPSASIAMGLERMDMRFGSGIEFVLRDDARLEISGVVYDGDEAGPFGQFSENDFVAVRFQYDF